MRESTLWVLHIFAGILIFFLLGLHMFIMHYDAILVFLGIGYQNPVQAESVFLRSKQFFFMITYILLLGTALYHGLYGLKNIIFELKISATLEKVTSWLLVLFGLLLFIYGAYAAIFVFLQPVQ